MDNLEQTTCQEYQKTSKKVLREVVKYGRIFLLGAGLALKGTAWYYGVYQAGSNFIDGNYKKAERYHATGYGPGIAGSILVTISGLSFLPDLLKKRKKKKEEKEQKSDDKNL